MYQNLLKIIKKHRTIIIHRHSKPDGDALGAQIGLKQALIDNFPDKKIYAVGDASPRYDFIGRMDNIIDGLYQRALVIVLDTAEPVLISDERYKMGAFLVKIDHHILKVNYGDLEIVDTSFESVCGLVANILFSLKLKVSAQTAQALFTGIITDSGRFLYDSVTPRTFEIASKLLEKGVNPSLIYGELYQDDLKTVRLRAALGLKFVVTASRVAYLKNTQKDILEAGTDIQTISRGMINLMSGIKEVDTWANFTESEDGKIIAEFRTSKYDVNKIAVKYGGGGHKKASGATLENWDMVDRVIEELNNLKEE
ncbi:MAG: DHH family phosphoesterase [Bacilli bacterium]|jgi:phosphoesterase RecJ-like protein